jgi:hypothetical protein
MCGGCDFDVFGEIKFTKILELQPTHIPYLTYHITSSPKLGDLMTKILRVLINRNVEIVK